MNNSELMAPENHTEKPPEMLRMGEKNSDNWKQLWEDGLELEPWILKRMEQDWEKKSSSVFKYREWRLETPPRIVDALRNEKWKGWSKDEKNLKDHGEKHLTDDSSFLRQTLERIWEAPVK